MAKAIFREAAPTTVSVGITHPNGERTFLTNPGHIGLLAPDFVSEALARFVEPGAPVLFCGAFLTTLLTDAYEEVFAVIRKKGGTVAVDTGWPPSGWNSPSRADLRRWAGLVDHLLLSEAEILGLTEAGSIDAAAAQMLPSLRPGATLVAKLGAAGAAAWRGDATASWPAPQVEVVDTIGAGDVFNAAYLASLLRGAGLAEAVRGGVVTASIAISTRPRRYEFPASAENPALLQGRGPR
jgi:sugar/nucleoside kinase (ribokinase family)